MNSKQIFVTFLFIMSLLLSGCSTAGKTTSTTTPGGMVQNNGKNIVDLVNEKSITYRITSGAINELGLEITNTTNQGLLIEILAGTYFVDVQPTLLHPADAADLQPADALHPAHDLQPAHVL